MLLKLTRTKFKSNRILKTNSNVLIEQVWKFANNSRNYQPFEKTTLSLQTSYHNKQLYSF